MNLTSAQVSIEQTTANANYHTNSICEPIVDLGAAVVAGLDQFNGTAEGARADEDGQQAKAPCAGEREGECREGYKVHEFVAALGCWGRHL